MAAKKEKLKDALGRIFREKGLSIGQVCAKLGQPTDSFRVRLSRNRFPRKLIPQLASIAGLPEDPRILEGLFEFEMSERINAGGCLYPVDLMPVIRAISETSIEKLSLDDFYYILNLQKNFLQPITKTLIEEALRLR